MGPVDGAGPRPSGPWAGLAGPGRPEGRRAGGARCPGRAPGLWAPLTAEHEEERPR